MKNSKWLLLAGLAIMVMTIGCEKQMGFVAPGEGDVYVAGLPLEHEFPGKNWALYFHFTPPGTEVYALSIQQDGGDNGGYVNVWQSGNEESLYVEYHTTGNYYLAETHVAVGLEVESIPHNKGGPNPGKFAHHTEQTQPYPQVVLMAIPWDASWDNPIDPDGLVMLTHCQVKGKVEVEPGVWEWALWEETGWGGEGGPKTINIPTDTVTMDLERYSVMKTGRSFFAVTLDGIGDENAGYNVYDGTWVGWCFDRSTDVLAEDGLRVRLWSCYDPDLPAIYQNDEWDKVSWLVNEYSGDNYVPSDYFLYHFNNAVYYLLGQYPSIADIPTVPPGHPEAESDLGQVMAAAAEAEGDGYYPVEPGSWFAVICDMVDHQDVAQPVFIEVDP